MGVMGVFRGCGFGKAAVPLGAKGAPVGDVERVAGEGQEVHGVGFLWVCGARGCVVYPTTSTPCPLR